jgi:hypothetical protein
MTPFFLDLVRSASHKIIAIYNLRLNLAAMQWYILLSTFAYNQRNT